jgi:hypothetical protein
MAKASTEKSKSKPAAPKSRWYLHVMAAATLIGLIVVSTRAARKYVDTKVDPQTAPPRVVFKYQPTWMSDVLANQITSTLQPKMARSTFDHDLLVETVEKLKTNPWIERVREVRRGYGKSAGDTLEIDADFRTPAALVRWGEYYSLVDAKGVKLPEQYPRDMASRIVHGLDGKVNIRVVEGVFNPPPDPGKLWRGEDLQAGLQMTKLLFDEPFAQDVIKVNVENVNRRISAKEAQIVLKTRYGTEIRWGRPISASDFFMEVSPEQKMASLRQIFQQYGRIDAKQPWLDLRFDKITYPSPASLPQAASN